MGKIFDVDLFAEAFEVLELRRRAQPEIHYTNRDPAVVGKARAHEFVEILDQIKKSRKQKAGDGKK